MGLTETDAWGALQAHREAERPMTIARLFHDEPDRATRLTINLGDLVVDFSKHLVSEQTVHLLADLARETGVEERRDAMFGGETINTTESRAVLHTALRAMPRRPEVAEVLERMGVAARRIRGEAGALGRWVGFDGRPIRTIVNIGIGGSDLGPLMATRALRHLHPRDLSVRYVSNVDGAHLDAVLDGLDPLETLIIVASKTFTTIETMTNARSAREWLLAAVGGDEAAIASHFVALSTNVDAVSAFGIDPANMFEFWDWVGGRYSVDSAIGFSLMCAVGPDAFDEFLGGFRIVDEHFATAPISANAPLLSGLIGVWYRNFHHWQTHAVLPYSQALERFPSYLQQLDMESNGKRVALDGTVVRHHTAPVVWGEPGTNGQHAFFQLLHQGSVPVPCDLIGFVHPEAGRTGIDRHEHHRLLFANMVAQAEALAFGRSAAEVRAEGVEEELVAHRTFPGNRPSTMIVAPSLTPSVLGQLIAFYEHRVFTQGAVWGINSFDQWGVELGKVLATRVAGELAGDTPGAHDPSTTAMIARYRDAQR